MDLEEIKLFLRLDGDEEDTLIEGLQIAAEEYLTNAGVTRNYTKELYKLAIKLLVTHWYENRNVVLIGTISKSLEFTLGAILMQLRYTVEAT